MAGQCATGRGARSGESGIESSVAMVSPVVGIVPLAEHVVGFKNSTICSQRWLNSRLKRLASWGITLRSVGKRSARALAAVPPSPVPKLPVVLKQKTVPPRYSFYAKAFSVTGSELNQPCFGKRCFYLIAPIRTLYVAVQAYGPRLRLCALEKYHAYATSIPEAYIQIQPAGWAIAQVVDLMSSVLSP